MSLPAQESSPNQWTKVRVQVLRYLNVLKRRWWVVLLMVSAGLCGTAWYAMQQPESWLSVGRMMVSGQVRLGGDTAALYSEELVNFFGTQVELMQSGEVQRRAHTRVRSLHPELQSEEVKLEVAQLPKASIFIMRATGQTAPYTQAFLDAVMDEYVATKKEMRKDKTEGAKVALQDELIRLEKVMQKEEDDMHEFQKANNIGFLEQEGNSAGLYLSQLNRQMADLKTEFDLLALLDLDQNLDRPQIAPSVSEKGLGRLEPFSTTIGPLAEYMKAKQQVQQLKADRADLSKNLRNKHPVIVALDEQIAKGEAILQTFREQSVELLKNRRESIRLQIENLQGVIKQWEAKALDLAKRFAEFNKLKSGSERTKAMYDRLLANLKGVDVTRNIEQDSVSILERASTPKSVRPGLVQLLILGAGGGLFLALGILFLTDKFDDRIGSFFEFRERFPENLLGQVPSEPTKGPMALLMANDPRHAMLESFRTLRSSIIFLPVEGARPKTLLVTSATPGEGKTTIAANLAIMFAFSGAKTLLVDADLRLGRLAKAFNVDTEIGFSDVLRQRINWREAVTPSSTPNLSLLPRGKTLAHPSEHFLGKVTDQFLQEVYPEYDYIIFDSPPVMAADDVLSLAPKIDGTIFVIRFSTSSARRSRTAVNLLSQRQANVLGLVCNDVRLAEAEYGYGSYYQYSSYRDSAATREAEAETKAGV
jgi:capsular exopolysaccharide synthesis family protein